MTTLKLIFERVSMVNPATNSISSLGSYVSQSAQMVADSVYAEVVNNLPTESLAYKILTTHMGRYSDKQLWVMAYELAKNNEYANGVVAEYNEKVARQKQKNNESKAKLQANKDASADVLAPIKELRKLGEFGKWLNTSKNPFRKEHFNKKYTQASINAFLNTL
jgi:hypothetical protein